MTDGVSCMNEIKDEMKLNYNIRNQELPGRNRSKKNNSKVKTWIMVKTRLSFLSNT